MAGGSGGVRGLRGHEIQDLNGLSPQDRAAFLGLDPGFPGLKNIAIQAWQAAAGAYNAIVSIPYVGPVLAPMAAATALGAVMVLGSHIASAEGGWERVPSDQVTQLHKNEMVLPSHIAEPVRQMAANGGNNGSQGDMHVHIHAVDARSLTSLLARNPEALLGPIRTAAANRRLA